MGVGESYIVDDQVRDNFITHRSAIQTHHNMAVRREIELPGRGHGHKKNEEQLVGW